MKRKSIIAVITILATIIAGCGVGTHNTQTETSNTYQDPLQSEAAVSESVKESEFQTELDVPTEMELPTEPEIPTESEVPTESESPSESEIPSESEVPAESELPTETPSESEEPEIVYTYRDSNLTMWATATVNVRSLPSTDGKKLGVLNYNDEVQATGQCNETGWYRVIYKGQTGYVSNKYLTELKPKEEWPEISANDIFIPELNADTPIIVIDAGHQEFVNKNKEPNGPGSSIMKKKVSRGTKGCVTDWWEYELNLVVAMKLKAELTARGYQVVMIRETHEINISNSERAKVANNINADAFIRIHANGSNDPSEQGAFTICQTPDNPYVGDKYESYRLLADCIIDEFAISTGCIKREVWETDTMSGINWAQVPTTILEMGFMTNPEEDTLMATEEYQDKMVQGIANGIERFLEIAESKTDASNSSNSSDSEEVNCIE